MFIITMLTCVILTLCERLSSIRVPALSSASSETAVGTIQAVVILIAGVFKTHVTGL